MRNIADTLDRIAKMRGRSGLQSALTVPDRLADFVDFGSNPGALRARVYVPEGLAPNAALVVALHGCTQTAAAYDHGAGWSQLADRSGFAVLFPEQQRANNPNLCFNWFAPGDVARDSGEALSIRQMIEAFVARRRLDRQRVFITGLSAGGAMTAAMLATYPALFAAGAVISGLPYGCASTIPEAFDRMRGHGIPSPEDLQALLRNASPHRGSWPSISVWHGTADQTVDVSNAEAIVDQWRGVHRAGGPPDRTVTVDGHMKRSWLGDDGREAIAHYVIAGMGHGVPLATRGPEGLGAAGPFMIEAGISSTLHCARSWGLAPQHETREGRAAPAPPARAPALVHASSDAAERRDGRRAMAHERKADAPQAVGGVRKVIEDALRAAGLM